MPVVSSAKPYLRKYEEMDYIVADSSLYRCRGCDKQLVNARFHWSDDAPFTVTTNCINLLRRHPVGHWASPGKIGVVLMCDHMEEEGNG